VGLLAKILGTTLDVFGIGNNAPGNKTLEARTSDSATPPALRWNDSALQWEFSNDGTTWVAMGAGGISETTHKTLRQLIHFTETNSPGDGFGAGPYYCETLYTSNVFPLNETWYETSAKLKKICRWEGTYNANKTFATEKWIVYKSDGVNPAADATDTISYSGVTETTRSRVVVTY
jgi:hypothetical protein